MSFAIQVIYLLFSSSSVSGLYKNRYCLQIRGILPYLPITHAAWDCVPRGDTQSRSDYGHQKARFERAGLFAHWMDFPGCAHRWIRYVNFLWKKDGVPSLTPLCLCPTILPVP